MKSFSLPKLIAFVIVLMLSAETNAQVNRDKNPIKLDYFTYDRIVNPTNLKIEYSTYYDKGRKVFINAPEGNWSNTTTSEYLALVNPDNGKPYKVRINGGIFEVTEDDGFNSIKKANSIKFQGWDGQAYKVVVSDFLN